MALSIQTLLDSTKDIYSLSLVAGTLGLQHSVSWVYYTEDASTIDFIRGGELAITTGMNIARTNINTGIDDPFYNRRLSYDSYKKTSVTQRIWYHY